MVAACPASNTVAVQQDTFFTDHWDAHHIGWLISGVAAAVTCGVSLLTIIGHATHYNKPLEQRQIVRILLFAPIFAVISFFSYRFFRAYTYYELGEVVWEALAIAAFLMLLLQYIGESVEMQVEVFVKKDKKKLPLPFCCWRYRPSKAYFLFLLKWSVIQYVIVRPSLSIAGIVLEYYELLCNQSLSPVYGHVYLLAIDFVSISIALYGLIVLYGLVKEELKGRRPLAKFMTIKLAIFFTFYQAFVFSILENYGIIKGTEYWTPDNVSNGLNALCVTLEMVIVSFFQAWAFDWREYRLRNISDGSRGKPNAKGRTNPFWAILHALNFSDYFIELWHSLRFAFDRLRGKDYTRQDARFGKMDFLVFQGGAHPSNTEKGRSLDSMDESAAVMPTFVGNSPSGGATAMRESRDTVPMHSLYGTESIQTGVESTPSHAALLQQPPQVHVPQEPSAQQYPAYSPQDQQQQAQQIYQPQPAYYFHPYAPQQMLEQQSHVSTQPPETHQHVPQHVPTNPHPHAPSNPQDNRLSVLTADNEAPSRPLSWEPQAM